VWLEIFMLQAYHIFVILGTILDRIPKKKPDCSKSLSHKGLR
jgi:hypothetical protein